MTYIKRVRMSGFKSFGDRTVSVSLSKGFTCIIGPNGNGKSNVIDALCFALGRMSKKTMRAKKLSDLIFAGSKKTKGAGKAEVDIVFDNQKREFPSETNEFIISRWIKRAGSSGYKIQGKGATRIQVLNALAQANIDPDGSNQFVLQGKIVELTHINTNARREFIERLIGLEKYDEMKNKTLKELEKADKDLGQFEAIFKEVSAQLQKVEKEKNDALKWMELDNSIKLSNAQLIALKIHKLNLEKDEIESDMDETALIIDELESKIEREKKKLEAEKMLFQNIEEDLFAEQKEKDELEQILSELKSKISANEATLKANKENLLNLEDRIEKLKKQQDPLEDGQTYDDLKQETQTQIDETQQVIDETSAKIEESIAQQKELEIKIGEINKEISKVQQDIKGKSTENKLLEKSIKKNIKKIEKNEADLKRLKVEKGKIQEAIDATQKESDTANEEIETLRKNIEEQKTHQKEIDSNLTTLEKTRDKAINKQSEIQAAISSSGAEIGMLEKQIADLESKKVSMQKEYDKLTKGKKVEEQIKQLEGEKATNSKELKKKKEELKKINTDQKRAESKKESLELKRRTLETDLNAIKSKNHGYNVEIKQLKDAIKDSEKEIKNSNTQLTSIQTDIKKNTTEKKKINKTLEKLNTKITGFTEEKGKIQDLIKKKETEQEKSTSELQGALKILSDLIQNVDRSAENVKAVIQNASQVAIDESSSVFKNFVLDITDMLSSIEEVSNLAKAEEIKEQIGMVVDTLKILIENADEPIEQLNELVQDASEEALQESTEKFDGFIQDFVEKFDHLNLILQEVAVSDTSESYQNLDELNQKIADEQTSASKEEKVLTKLEAQLDQAEKEIKKIKTQIDQAEKKNADNLKKIKTKEASLKDHEEELNTIQIEIDELVAEMESSKSTNFFAQVDELNKTIDAAQEGISKINEDLNALNNVKRLLEDIESATKDQEKAQSTINTKKKALGDLSKSSDTAKTEMEKINTQIGESKEEREKADEKRGELQENIDKKTEELTDIASRRKDVENVQKLISENESLKVENETNTQQIETNTTDIESLNTNVGEQNKSIENLTQKRTTSETEEADFRTQLSAHSANKNKLEKTFDQQNQMVQRALEIENLLEELKNLDEQIEQTDKDIAEFLETQKEKEEQRTVKIQEITELQGKRSTSINNQNEMQGQIGDLNADLSRNSAKNNNLETRKITAEERIDEFYEKSKEFGTLPPVTSDLGEDTLNNSIAEDTTKKKKLEPVNLKSIDEFDVIKERWDEIDMRRQTLQRERKAIIDSIEKIELEKTRQFMKAFHEINRVFSTVFQKLSPGGSSKMILEDPAHPFEAGITIEARPRGKKISSLTILSGGEKTLVALSFIFAIQNFYPAPFYIMDEIDAALDGPNVYRVSKVIKEYSGEAQFLVISHREENITNADTIYGVSMSDGITDVFSVDLEEEKQRDDYNTPDQ